MSIDEQILDLINRTNVCIIDLLDIGGFIMFNNQIYNQHDVYSELEKKNIFAKNNQTQVKPSAYSELQKLDVKNYTRIKELKNDVTVLDFETTGGSHIYSEVIQVGAVKYRNGKEIGRFDEFVRPTSPIPPKITRLTGITNLMVQNARPTSQIFYDLSKFLQGEVLVAHNASFDMKFLLTYFHKLQINHEKFKVIDSVPLARQHLTQLPNHKLETIKHFLEINIDSHQAINDCLVTGELYYLCKMLSDGQQTLPLF